MEEQEKMEIKSACRKKCIPPFKMEHKIIEYHRME